MKTKIFNQSLLRLMLVGVMLVGVSQMTWGEWEKIGEFYYVLNKTKMTAKVTYDEDYSHLGYVTPLSYGNDKVVIPSYVTYNGNTYSVTEIGDKTFYGNILNSITIPNSVTSIGEYNQEIKGETNVEIIPVIA